MSHIALPFWTKLLRLCSGLVGLPSPNCELPHLPQMFPRISFRAHSGTFQNRCDLPETTNSVSSVQRTISQKHCSLSACILVNSRQAFFFYLSKDQSSGAFLYNGAYFGRWGQHFVFWLFFSLGSFSHHSKIHFSSTWGSISPPPWPCPGRLATAPWT